MAIRGWSRKRIDEAVELNITAFMNLMVILVPFLLVTAVFSRLTVIELNLPLPDATASQTPVELQLELIVRPDRFEINDARLGLIKTVDRTPGEQDWREFTDVMLEIKRRYPQEQEITILLEKSIEYKTLIAVMDRVRSAQVVQVGSVESVELFPLISIGDAQTAAPGASPGESLNTEAAPQ